MKDKHINLETLFLTLLMLAAPSIQIVNIDNSIFIQPIIGTILGQKTIRNGEWIVYSVYGKFLIEVTKNGSVRTKLADITDILPEKADRKQLRLAKPYSYKDEDFLIISSSYKLIIIKEEKNGKFTKLEEFIPHYMNPVVSIIEIKPTQEGIDFIFSLDQTFYYFRNSHKKGHLLQLPYPGLANLGSLHQPQDVVTAAKLFGEYVLVLQSTKLSIFKTGKLITETLLPFCTPVTEEPILNTGLAFINNTIFIQATSGLYQYFWNEDSKKLEFQIFQNELATIENTWIGVVQNKINDETFIIRTTKLRRRTEFLKKTKKNFFSKKKNVLTGYFEFCEFEPLGQNFILITSSSLFAIFDLRTGIVSKMLINGDVFTDYFPSYEQSINEFYFLALPEGKKEFKNGKNEITFDTDPSYRRIGEKGKIQGLYIKENKEIFEIDEKNSKYEHIGEFEQELSDNYEAIHDYLRDQIIIADFNVLEMKYCLKAFSLKGKLIFDKKMLFSIIHYNFKYLAFDYDNIYLLNEENLYIFDLEGNFKTETKKFGNKHINRIFVYKRFQGRLIFSFDEGMDIVRYNSSKQNFDIEFSIKGQYLRNFYYFKEEPEFFYAGLEGANYKINVDNFQQFEEIRDWKIEEEKIMLSKVYIPIQGSNGRSFYAIYFDEGIEIKNLDPKARICEQRGCELCVEMDGTHFPQNFKEAEECLACRFEYTLVKGKCNLNCDKETEFYDESLGVCGRCHSSCRTCKNSQQCESCWFGEYLSQNHCYKGQCPKIEDQGLSSSYLEEKGHFVCNYCQKGCKVCIEEQKCVECFENYVMTEDGCSKKTLKKNLMLFSISVILIIFALFCVLSIRKKRKIEKRFVKALDDEFETALRSQDGSEGLEDSYKKSKQKTGALW